MPAKVYRLARPEWWAEWQAEQTQGDDEDELDPAIYTPAGVRWEDVSVFGLRASQAEPGHNVVEHPSLTAVRNIFSEHE